MHLLTDHWELLLFFFGIALLYATVGFGGGSSYIAVLAAYEVSYLLLRPVALICNITVVGGGVWLHLKRGHLRWRKTLPLVLLSVPMAFLGAWLRIEETLFYLILAASLTAAGLLTLFRPSPSEGEEGGRNAWVNALIGGGIGFLSGLVGIGGGIFLAPLLHLTQWDRPKAISAAASLFILVNSAAGLAGHFISRGLDMDWGFAAALAGAVLLGGQVGSRLGTGILPQRAVKTGTALLVLFVGIRLLVSHL